MSLLSWFDNRTLFCCQFLMAGMFALVFLWLSRVYPNVRAVRWVMWSFLAGVPSTFFVVMRGQAPVFVSVVLANLMGALSFYLMYLGVLEFLRVRRSVWVRLWVPVGASAVAVGVVFYWSEVRRDIVPRIVAMGLVCAMFRGMMAWELLRDSWGRGGRAGGLGGVGEAGRSNRGTMRFFGILMAFLSAVSLHRAVVTVWQGAPQNLMQANAVQTSTILLTLLYIGGAGFCFLMMTSHELVLASQEASEKDVLSGLYNRRGIEARLSVELRRSRRSLQRLSVGLVDIDHFKRINDEYGHAAGDGAIRAIAEAMGSRLREEDLLGRYGGDEFLLILPHTTGEDAALVVERLRAAVAGLSEWGRPGSGMKLALSVGLTEASPGDDTLGLLARADEALYEAKRGGRDGWRLLMPGETFPEAPGRSGQGGQVLEAGQAGMDGAQLAGGGLVDL